MKSPNEWRRIPALVVGMFFLVCSAESFATDLNNSVLAKATTEWWQWALSIPADGHPLLPRERRFPDRGDCVAGQHGEIWFLGGDFSGTGDPIVRECIVPKGYWILIPVINAECSEVEGNGTSVPELQDCASDLMDQVTSTMGTLNGYPLRVRRIATKGFQISLAGDNVLGIANPSPNPSLSVADGFWVAFRPRKPGIHILTTLGDFSNGAFVQDVTYTLIIR